MKRVEFQLTDAEYRAANLAAANCNGLTVNQLAKCVLMAAAKTMADNDQALMRLIENPPAKIPASARLIKNPLANLAR